ncbi:hypothetical protein D3C80_1000020 [compost metagenome]
MQPVGVQVAGDEIGDQLRALAVIHRDFLVQAVELVGGVIGAGAYRENRQAGQQRALAQFEDARVGFAVAGQQQAGQRHAVDRRQAHRKDDVVAVARGHYQRTGLEQRHGIGHGAGTDDDLVHPPGFVVAGIEHLGAEQFGHVAGTRIVEAGLERDAAEQAEVAAAQQR